MNKIFRITALVLIVIVIFIAGRMVYFNRASDKKTVSGMVTKISENRLKEIVVSLRDVRGIHYISKSSMKGLNAAELHSNLVNKRISITYLQPGIVSKFAPGTETRLITRIVSGDSLIYSSSD